MAEITTHKAVQTKFGAYPAPGDEKAPGANCLAEVDVHTYGHIALISTYGSDQAIEDAARISYGKTLDKVEEVRKFADTRNLLRYMMRKNHTSPFEMAEVTFYLRTPIFVARQQLRHRTANVNELSARYTELSDDYYVPDAASLAYQSTTNKQGREGTLPAAVQAEVTNIMVEQQEGAVRAYHQLLNLGVSREISRIVTPVGMYTEMYWKIDLHNLFHTYLNRRMDEHAQQEIQDYAHPMFNMVKPFFPISAEAYVDYVYQAYTVSGPEQALLGIVLRDPSLLKEPNRIKKPVDMSVREFADFKRWLDSVYAG